MRVLFTLASGGPKDLVVQHGRQVGSEEHISYLVCHRPMHNVEKLSRIPRPAVVAQKAGGPGGYRADGQPQFVVVTAHGVIHQRQDILPSVAQGREHDQRHSQAVARMERGPPRQAAVVFLDSQSNHDSTLCLTLRGFVARLQPPGKMMQDFPAEIHPEMIEFMKNHSSLLHAGQYTVLCMVPRGSRRAAAEDALGDLVARAPAAVQNRELSPAHVPLVERSSQEPSPCTRFSGNHQCLNP